MNFHKGKTVGGSVALMFWIFKCLDILDAQNMFPLVTMPSLNFSYAFLFIFNILNLVWLIRLNIGLDELVVFYK